jgi:hypothetical protein
VGQRQTGLASGLVSTAQQVGGAVGVAVIATVAATRTTSLLAGATSPASVLAALVGGFWSAAVAEAAIAATGALLALFLLGSASGPVAAPRASGPAATREQEGTVMQANDGAWDRPTTRSGGDRGATPWTELDGRSQTR